jgi:hypothetical protein
MRSASDYAPNEYPGGIMTVLRNTAGDPAKQQQAIEALAKESDAPVEHVRELFEIEHARLNSQARVKTFVSVIATRLVRNTLHAERTNS